MKEDQQLTIDGDKYVIRSMKTSEGARTLIRLAKLVLPNAQGVGSIFDAKNQLLDLFDKPIDFEAFLKALGERMDDEAIMGVVETTLSPLSVVRGGKMIELRDAYDEHFKGRYETLFKVFFAALRHNYASFFADVPAIVASFLNLKKAAPTSQASSPNQSTQK
jgi:hypothetical protein